MYFASLSDFFAMGQHGIYVWSAYAVALAVLGLNIMLPLLARRRYLKQAARQLRREQSL